MRIRPLLPLLSLVAGCGGPLFSVGADAERVCVRQSGEALDLSSLPPLPTGLQIGGAVERDLTIDAGDLRDVTQDVRASLGLLSFDLTAPELLAGVKVLQVSLRPPAGSGLPAITLVNYRADGTAAQDGALVRIADGTLHADLAAAEADLSGYLASGSFAVHLAADATLPSGLQDVPVAVELCTKVDASYDYGEKLGL